MASSGVFFIETRDLEPAHKSSVRGAPRMCVPSHCGFDDVVKRIAARAAADQARKSARRRRPPPELSVPATHAQHLRRTAIGLGSPHAPPTDAPAGTKIP